jgi:exonuclease SbcD
MKIVHTGDWHIGHVLYGYDRACDHSAMLGAITNVVKKEQPDALIVSGDVFHTGQPSAASTQLLADALLRIKEACPTMSIIATAGNHDSPSRHEMFAGPWQALGVTMIGQTGCNAGNEITDDILDRLILPVANKGYVIAMPYVHPRNLPENFYQKLLDRASALNTGNLPVVLMAHLTVSGVDITGHENSNEHVVGGIDAVSLAELGTGYDYLALGHIHHPQFVPGSDNRARYAGTPLPVSFDEAYEHSVSVVTIDAHGSAPDVREVPMTAGRKLITLGGRKGMTWDEIRSNLEFSLNAPDIEKGALVRVNMHLAPGECMPTDAESVVRQAITAAGHLYCLINVVREDINTAVDEHDLAVDELRNIPPINIAKRYIEDRGIAFTDDMADMFNEILSQLNDQENDRQ